MCIKVNNFIMYVCLIMCIFIYIYYIFIIGRSIFLDIKGIFLVVILSLMSN